MAATVTIRRLTSTGPTATDVTSTTSYLQTDDAHAASSPAYPIPIPASSNNYSYWATYQLSADTTPATAISNLAVYTDGTNTSPGGITYIAQEATSYVQASGTQGTTGLQLTTGNHAGITGAPADPFGWNSGSPKALAGSIANPSTGLFGSMCVLQAVVASTTAATGDTTAEVLTFSYDET